MQTTAEKCFKWRAAAGSAENILKYFRGKEALDLSGGTLQRLDISALPELIELDASNSALDALYAGQNSRLQYLNLAGSLMTELSTRGLSCLRTLCVSDTGICQLNTVFLYQLESLQIVNTAIQHIDLRNLHKLRHFAANQSVKALDLRQCKEIRTLIIADTALQRISLCGRKRLQTLHVCGAAIKYLDCRCKWTVQQLTKNADYIIIQGANE